jgi:hypothetical protein
LTPSSQDLSLVRIKDQSVLDNEVEDVGVLL